MRGWGWKGKGWVGLCGVECIREGLGWVVLGLRGNGWACWVMTFEVRRSDVKRFSDSVGSSAYDCVEL